MSVETVNWTDLMAKLRSPNHLQTIKHDDFRYITWLLQLKYAAASATNTTTTTSNILYNQGSPLLNVIIHKYLTISQNLCLHTAAKSN